MVGPLGEWRDRCAPSPGVQIEAGMRWSAVDDVRASHGRRTLYPAATVPWGWTRDSLPVGWHIATPRLAEGLVLWAAAACETIAPWAHKRPSLD